MTRDQFTKEFEQSSGQLKSFILRITASVADTEDILQDTWLKATEKLDGFNRESTLKTWIFAIAANLAKDNLRARKRWVDTVLDISKEAALANPRFFEDAMAIRENSPQG